MHDILDTYMSLEKPHILYHGSLIGDLELIEPRIGTGEGEAYGARVYATQDIATALIFTAHITCDWSMGILNDNSMYVVIPMTRAEFELVDTGGYIYELPSDSFDTDPGRGLGYKEYASPVSVVPKGHIHIQKTLYAMIKHGVRVYFVKPEDYTEYMSTSMVIEKLLEKYTPEI